MNKLTQIYAKVAEYLCGRNSQAAPTPVVSKPLEATLGSVTPNYPLSDSMTNSYQINPVINFPDFSNTGDMKKVWIYNVSTLDFEVDTALGIVKFPGRGKKKYSTVTSLPMIVTHPRTSVDDNAAHGVFTDGRRVAMDIINPDNYTLDQNNKTDEVVTGMGRDLSAKGVFWSLNNPPTDKEIREARARMKARYKMLLEEAGVKSRVTPKRIFDKKIANLVNNFNYTVQDATVQVYEGLLSITPEHHAAMDCYALTNQWHPIKHFVTTQ